MKRRMQAQLNRTGTLIPRVDSRLANQSNHPGLGSSQLIGCWLVYCTTSQLGMIQTGPVTRPMSRYHRSTAVVGCGAPRVGAGSVPGSGDNAIGCTIPWKSILRVR